MAAEFVTVIVLGLSRLAKTILGVATIIVGLAAVVVVLWRTAGDVVALSIAGAAAEALGVLVIAGYAVEALRRAAGANPLTEDSMVKQRAPVVGVTLLLMGIAFYG